MPMLVYEPAQYTESDQDDTLKAVLLLEQEIDADELPSAPPMRNVVPCYPPSGYARNSSWSLTKYFKDQVYLFNMYTDMANDEPADILVKQQDSLDFSGLSTMLIVGGTAIYHSATYVAVRIQMSWVLNTKHHAFEYVVQTAQSSVPHVQ